MTVIEFGIFNNGPSDLPIKEIDGILLPEGDLNAVNRSTQRMVRDQIRNGVLAEKLGFHYCFFTEHHFQPEGNEFSPNPLMLGAAIAAQTRHIRLGQAANILSWHHPIRIAEQAAMLDVMSGGRLEFGVGRGGQPRETEVFAPHYGSSSTDELRSLQFFEEAIEVIIKAWTQPSFSHQGQFFRFPAPYAAHHHAQTIAYFSQPNVGRTLEQTMKLGEPTGHPIGVFSHATTLKEMQVFPRPLQAPHPQIWQPVIKSTRSMRRAARFGMNVCVIGSGPEDIRQDVEAFAQASEAHGWPDRLGRKGFKRGWDSTNKRGLVHVQYLHLTGNGLGDAQRFRRGVASRSQFLGGFVPKFLLDKLDLVHENTKAGLNFIGGPQQIIDSFMKIKELGGYEDFLCMSDFTAGGISGSEIRDQMQCFAEEVMPELSRACGGAAPAVEADPEFSIST